jgi:hypothetical protein
MRTCCSGRRTPPDAGRLTASESRGRFAGDAGTVRGEACAVGGDVSGGGEAGRRVGFGANAGARAGGGAPAGVDAGTAASGGAGELILAVVCGITGR